MTDIRTSPPLINREPAKRFPAKRELSRASVAKVLGMGQNKGGPRSCVNSDPALEHRQLTGAAHMSQFWALYPLAGDSQQRTLRELGVVRQ
jgi:hypothetical protein